MLGLFYLLLLLIDNQSVLLPPEDEFDEYVANFLPYFFFGEKGSFFTETSSGGERNRLGFLIRTHPQGVKTVLPTA